MENTTPVTTALKNQISITITCARYAAIVSLVNLGLSLIQLIIGFVKGNPFIFFTLLLFLISTAITLVLAINLFKYAGHAERSISNEDSTELYQALYHLRNYFLVMGALFLIIIGLIGIFILFAIIKTILA